MFLSTFFPFMSIFRYNSLKKHITANSNSLLERGKLDKKIAQVHKDAGTNRSGAQMDGSELIPFFVAGPGGGAAMNPAINRMYDKCGFSAPGRMAGKEFVMGLLISEYVAGKDKFHCGQRDGDRFCISGILLFPLRWVIRNVC